MADTVHCDTHGESQVTFVCSHLADGNAGGLGFNRNESDDDEPFPDAWCNDCEVILEAHDGWNEESEKLITIQLVCSVCYERARIRNSRTDVTLDDLADLRWKCNTCEEWHTGPCLDLSYGVPAYWGGKDAENADPGPLSPDNLPRSFLNSELCIVDGEHFFVRGNIHLPIIGTTETFRWGVWGSLSEQNFKKLVAMFDDPKRVEMEPMFSWLSNQIDEYEDTLSVKMYAHISEPDERPRFEIEPTEHALAQEYYNGITAERVKEIMMRRLNDVH